MLEDWRFRESPHVRQGGLRAYAGVPLHFQTEFGEHVALGSLCVASNTQQEPPSKSKQMFLARLADWIVADIIQSARARRQRERRRMLELLSDAQERCAHDANHEEVLLDILRKVYPSTSINIQTSNDHRLLFEGGTAIPTLQLENGLWEDCDYCDYMIENHNDQDLVAPRVIRAIVAECGSARIPTFLVVGSKDFRLIFDDVDSWFVHTCASLLSRGWQNRALKEALAAKETFLRGITHQLRTPIHGILGSVELLAEELKSRNLIHATLSPTPTADVERLDPYGYINTIRTSALELISTVNSLIKLNRWADIAQAERVILLHHVDEIGSALLHEIAQVMPEDPSARPSIVFSHHLPPNCDSLAIDLGLLIDCIQPIAVNAVQNTAGGVVALTVSVTDDYQSLIVDVEDTGRGISPSDQQRIFHSYEKVDSYAAGAGLGLTLACKLATLMNGSVSLVSSDLNEGSHFRASFYEPACACSFNPPQPIRERFVHLPQTFCRLPASSKARTPSQYLSRYLTRCGFIESDCPEDSLLLLDYTTDLTQLQNQISQVGAEQAAICLVPDSECVIDFDGEQVRRQNNIIYLRGPFIPSTLAKALEQANLVLSGLALSKANSPSSSPGGIAIDASSPAPKMSRPSGHLPRPGSVFPAAVQADFLTYPVRRTRLDTTPPISTSTSPQRSAKPMTLLVDDNAINLHLLEMYCTRRGIPYRTANDGDQAVRLFSQQGSSAASSTTDGSAMLSPSLPSPSPQSNSFDLTLMDLQMPVCDGIAATRKIRDMERENGWEKSVIFIVTGQDSPADRKGAESVGADAFFVKPVGPKVLDREVGRWFSGSGIG